LFLLIYSNKNFSINQIQTFADDERRKIETKKAAVEKVQAACALELYVESKFYKS
jgi:hypothetical protein